MNARAFDKEIIVDLDLDELMKMKELVDKAIGTAELVERLESGENERDPFFHGFHPAVDYFEYDNETIKFGINSIKRKQNSNPNLEDV